MVKFRVSAFSDEYSPKFDEQIEGLLANQVHMTELRHIDEVNVSDLTLTQASEVRRKLDAAGIGVSAIGSPIGKIQITDPMGPHLDKLRNTCEVAEIVGTDRIRMFSFYVPEGEAEKYKDEVIDRIGRMLDVADEYHVKLCHENEKGIYGEKPEQCRTILDSFPGRLGCVFDPANFVVCGCEPFEFGYELLKKDITYMHIKDATRSGTVVPAGCGIGCLPEILALINLTRNGEFIVTVEPHLKVFSGLDKLQHGTAAIGNAYETSAEAFAAAVEALRQCIPLTAGCI